MNRPSAAEVLSQSNSAVEMTVSEGHAFRVGQQINVSFADGSKRQMVITSVGGTTFQCKLPFRRMQLRRFTLDLPENHLFWKTRKIKR